MLQHTFALRIGLFLACLSAVVAEKVEDVVTPVASAVAGTLLGAITFMMSMYYFLHHSDEDIRKYTYEAISGTISIFCAVLIFSTIDDLLDDYLLESTSPEFQASMAMLHMLFWFTVLQFALGFKSGALKRKSSKQSPKTLTDIKITLKSYSIMLSHITGFASINAWGSLQQLPYCHTQWWQPFAVVLVSALGQFALQRICDTIREKYCLWKDGAENELEDLWLEETADAEVDVMGLTLSFNSTQALRFAISGVFPDQEGKEVWNKLISHNCHEVVLLLGAGFGDLLVMLCVCYIKHHYGSQIYEWLGVEEDRSIVALMLDCTITTLTMINAWTWFYGMQWFLAGLNAIYKDSMMLSVILTMITSFLSFAAIFLLDQAADASKEGRPEMEHAFRSIIYSFSFLIGFGWEQCFDRAVTALSECVAVALPHFPNCYSLAKVLLVMFVVVLVAPAWKKFILPMLVQEGYKTNFIISDDNMPNVVQNLNKHLTEHHEAGGTLDLEVQHQIKDAVRTLQLLISEVMLAVDETNTGDERHDAKAKDALNRGVAALSAVDAFCKATTEAPIFSSQAPTAPVWPRRSSISRNRLSACSNSSTRRYSLQDSCSVDEPRYSPPTFGVPVAERKNEPLQMQPDNARASTDLKTGIAEYLQKQERDREVQKAIAELKDSSDAFLHKQEKLASENLELKASLEKLKQELQVYHRVESDRAKGVKEFSSQMGTMLNTISQIETKIRETSPEREKACGIGNERFETAATYSGDLSERLYTLKAPIQTRFNGGMLSPYQAPLLASAAWPCEVPILHPTPGIYEAYTYHRAPMG